LSFPWWLFGPRCFGPLRLLYSWRLFANFVGRRADGKPVEPGDDNNENFNDVQNAAGRTREREHDESSPRGAATKADGDQGPPTVLPSTRYSLHHRTFRHRPIAIIPPRSSLSSRSRKLKRRFRRACVTPSGPSGHGSRQLHPSAPGGHRRISSEESSDNKMPHNIDLHGVIGPGAAPHRALPHLGMSPVHVQGAAPRDLRLSLRDLSRWHAYRNGMYGLMLVEPPAD